MRNVPSLLALIGLCACGNAARPAEGNRVAEGNGTAESVPPPPHTGPSQPVYGPEQLMSGVFETRFERSDFNGCWLDFSTQASAQFRQLFPPDSADSPMRGRRYQMEIVGRRTIDGSNPDGPELYGHMNAWPCQIEATRIVAARVIGKA
jgi:hypothetical protein